ncbi:MAG: hypothetical protein AAB536_01355 [Patescibacteria group bacterium]
MRKRIIVLLKTKKDYYKFLSIFYSGKDGSYFLYNHLADEKTPLDVAEPFHLLRSFGDFSTNKLKKRVVENGEEIHLSIHPKRLYLKRRSIGSKEEHLIEEVEPQPFNEHGFRLHCVFTPAPREYLPKYNLATKRESEDLIIFEWESVQCPQISFYELSVELDFTRVSEILPQSIAVKTVKAEKNHHAIALHLQVTNGDPGVWHPNCIIFGKIIQKKPIDKTELQRIITYNEAGFDISSLPDDAVIHDYKVQN